MKYYILEQENNDSYPILEWGNDIDNIEISIAKNREVKPSGPVELLIGEPIPKNPLMVDYHELPKPVFSKKIYDLLEPLKLNQVQLVPAYVLTNNVTYDYWILYVRNLIECMDKNKSKVHYRTDGKTLSMVDKLFLDFDKLEQIPEENRLVFRLAEFRIIHIYHEKIKKLIESVKPVGLQFFSVEEWDDTSSFKR